MENETALTFAYAVQPQAWERLDEHGCDYVPDLELALAVAKLWAEPCTVWACPSSGVAYPLKYA